MQNFLICEFCQGNLFKNIIPMCHRIKKSKCSGRAIRSKDENGNVTIKTTGKHHHSPDIRQLEKKKIVEDVKEKAKTNHKTSCEIVAAACSVANEAVQPVLPSVKEMMRLVQYERKNTSIPRNPNNLHELQLNNEYTTTESGQNFLFFDSGPGDKRLLIFSTNENIKQLVKCDAIHMDGTFDVVPPLFTQLYTIHGKKLLIYLLFLIFIVYSVQYFLSF